MPEAHSSRWPRRLLFVCVPGLLLVMGVSAAINQTPKDMAIVTAIAASGLYTVVLWATRRFWLPRLASRPVRNAVLLGVFNAAFVEMLFLVIARLFGATGVAAHPNPVADLLITMPWYVPMVWTFVRVQNRRRFAAVTVLYLAGLYETGADGLLAGYVLPVVTGGASPLNPAPLLLPFGFWGFVAVYSSMVLAPAWVVRAAAPPPESPTSPAWRDALKPLVWLIPYAILAIPLLLLAARQ